MIQYITFFYKNVIIYFGAIFLSLTRSKMRLERAVAEGAGERGNSVDVSRRS
jgi:hypothetical protein